MKTALYGRMVFGASAALFGVIALIWHDADTWQTLRQIWSLPFGVIAGGCLMIAQIAGGIAMQYPRTAGLASMVLGVVYLLFSLACIPEHPRSAGRLCDLRKFFRAVCVALRCDCPVRCNGSESSTGCSLWPNGASWTWSLRHLIYGKSSSLSSCDLRLGSKVDSAQSDVLGHIYDDCVCTRGDCHSRQSRCTARVMPHDPYVGALWRDGLDSAPDRSPGDASELVRIQPNFPYYRGCVDGGRFELLPEPTRADAQMMNHPIRRRDEDRKA